ncbi:phage tail tape measure protein [Paenibacillus sp. FSL R7-0302]|uniref:phage tail tape measure protein n=1 Tax=Paenibacillus sp. FSL R7-0302 TaxID=2921681 RepID=UPI0030F83EBF
MAGGIIGSLMYAVGFKFNSKGLDGADKKISKLTKGVVAMGAAAGAAMVGIAAAGINAASNYETAMKQVEGATGATAEQMEATRGIAKNLYANNFGEDWNDLGAAIANVQQVTGQTGAELENTTRNAILMRDQFGFEIPESIKSVDTMMKQFGITSEDAYNLLAQGAQRGLDKSGELVDSANEYANQFKSLGFSADEMFDVFAAGSKEGVFQVDKVGDAVKEFNIRSKDGSKTSMDAFTALGLNAEAMMQTFARGGPQSKQAFSDIVSMISDIADPVARNNIGVALMGSQFEDLEINVISAMGAAGKSFDKSKKTMDELNKIKFEKPGEAMKMFGRQIEVGILIPIGQKLLPYFNQFGQWLSEHKPQIEAVGNAIGNGLGKALGAVAGWVKAALPYLQQFGSAVVDKVGGWIQTAMPYLQQFGQMAGDAFNTLVTKGQELWTSLQPIVELVGTKLLGAAVALWPEIQNIAAKMYDVGKAVVEWGGFIPIVSGIAAMLLTYKAAIFAVTTATKIAGIATKVWSGITKAFTAVQTAFNAVISMNPIALIVLALVGLGVALTVAYKRSDKFRAFIDKMWAGIKTATAATLNFFKVTIPKAFMTAFNAVTAFLKKWGFVLLAVIGGPVGLVVGLIIKHWDKVKAVTVAVFTAVWNWLKSAWNWIKTTVSDGASAVWDAVTGAWNKVKEVTSSIFTAVWNKIKSIWSSITGSVSGAVSGVWNAIKGAWNRVFDTTNSLMTKVWNKITGIWGQIISGIKGVGTKMLTAVKDMWESVTGFFEGIDLMQMGKDIIQSLIDGIGSMAENLMIKVRSLGEKIKNAFSFKTTATAEVETPDAVLGRVVDGSNANGLAYVPFDGYISELHKGERVLTAKENKEYSRINYDRMPQWTMPNSFSDHMPAPIEEKVSRDSDPYTPESAPARTTNNQRVNFTAPSITITVQGNADAKTAQEIGSIVDQKLQDFLESASRIMGVEISGAN